MSKLYIAVIIVTFVIGILSTWYVNSSLKKYREVATSSGLTGLQIAKNMMKHYGIGDLTVTRGRANQNHFNPRKNSITLDPHVYKSSSVTAIATACHEVGHACQFAQGYFFMKVRSALVPVVQLTQGSWFIVLIVGILINMSNSGGNGLNAGPGSFLIDLALILYAVSVAFHIITLPVEFNASSRALEYMEEIGIAEEEKSGAARVLRACALTYVATALISAIYLLYRAVRYRRVKL